MATLSDFNRLKSLIEEADRLKAVKDVLLTSSTSIVSSGNSIAPIPYELNEVFWRATSDALDTVESKIRGVQITFE